MLHEEHINLIKKAITNTGGVWADLGSGAGAFTLALRDLTGPEVEIFSVDTETTRLAEQKKQFDKQFPDTNIHFLEQDFTKSLKLPKLDGILLANSLHYVEDQEKFLIKLKQMLKPHGKLVLVEYNIDTQQPPWVPYALSYKTFEKLATRVGFTSVELLEKIPSTYWDEMYSAQATLA